MATNYNNANLNALHKGLTTVHPEQDRVNFAPKFASDIRILMDYTDSTGNDVYLNFNKVYDATDPNFPELAGTIWVVSDIEGWWNTSEPMMPNIERGFEDGSFDVTGRFQARDLTITGSIINTAFDRAGIASASSIARKILIEAFNLVKRSTYLIVDEDTYRRSALVRLSGRPEISMVNSKGRIDFSIGLRAGDPVKYEWIDSTTDIPSGTTNLGIYRSASIANNNLGAEYRGYLNRLSSTYNDTTGIRGYDEYTYDAAINYRNYLGNTSTLNSDGNAIVYNYGDSNVYCILRVVGPLIGPAIITNTTTSQSLTILSSSSGYVLGPYQSNNTVEYLDINTRTREVHKGDYTYGNSTISSRSLVDPLTDWIYLAPGANVFTFIDQGSDSAVAYPTLEIYWRSGWIG